MWISELSNFRSKPVNSIKLPVANVSIWDFKFVVKYEIKALDRMDLLDLPVA